MDSVWHSAIGTLLYVAPLKAIGIEDPTVLGFAAGLGSALGSAPDAIGEVEPEPVNERKRWNWYRDAHWGGEICEWMKSRWYWYWTLPWVIHAWVDRFLHKEPVVDELGRVVIPGQRWWKPKERLWVWAVLWSSRW